MINPKSMVMNFIQRNSNPVFGNLIQMANENNKQGLENFARNICNQRGLDFDKEFTNFINNFKG